MLSLFRHTPHKGHVSCPAPVACKSLASPARPRGPRKLARGAGAGEGAPAKREEAPRAGPWAASPARRRHGGWPATLADMSPKPRTGGELIVDALVKGGVTHAFGIAGVHNLPVYDALYNSDHIDSFVTRHEQGAA